VGQKSPFSAAIWVLAALGMAGSARAADPQQLALSMRAQSDFDRVAKEGPVLPDATRCEQSQAALLAVATPQEAARIHFRKAYCGLATATLTHSPNDFRDASAEFEKALKTWSPPTSNRPREGMIEPVPSSLRVLAAVARLETDSSPDSLQRERLELSSAVDPVACPNEFLPAADCLAVVRTGRLWLAWIALSHNDLDEAGRALKSMPDAAWSHWIAGKSAFRYREFPQADLQYGLAVEDWMREQSAPAPALAPRLAPQPDIARALTDWAGTQLLTGDLKQATANLDTAIQRDPHLAFALFLRARAKELASQNEEAQADLSLASRTAFAEAKDLASGEAHLYRGIMLYRRKDYSHAEAEFSSALNFEIPVDLRPDAVAWRHLAAVAGGACASSREFLEQSLAAVSPYFPKDEARAAAAKCPLTASGI